jgi:NAD(P)H dehydrogenase (quinone)
MEGCDLMIWQFPVWRFGLPAVLKGWVDRVFAMGRTYGGDHFYECAEKRHLNSFPEEVTYERE